MPASRYARTHLSDAFAADFASLANGAVDEEASVALCGRVMTKRMFGKLAFFTVQQPYRGILSSKAAVHRRASQWWARPGLGNTNLQIPRTGPPGR